MGTVNNGSGPGTEWVHEDGITSSNEPWKHRKKMKTDGKIDSK
jgi:hypothetical protein